jgi:hypothetical protein
VSSHHDLVNSSEREGELGSMFLAYVVYFGRKQANKEAERISQRCASETTSMRARARSKAGPVQLY